MHPHFIFCDPDSYKYALYIELAVQHCCFRNSHNLNSSNANYQVNSKILDYCCSRSWLSPSLFPILGPSLGKFQDGQKVSRLEHPASEIYLCIQRATLAPTVSLLYFGLRPLTLPPPPKPPQPPPPPFLHTKYYLSNHLSITIWRRTDGQTFHSTVGN